MKNVNRKWWLTALALLLLVPVASAKPLKHNHQHRHANVPVTAPVNVPESGSALAYVFGAGVTCLGAMLMRSRSTKPE